MIGFHNWIQFYLQEKAGNVDYQGYILGKKVMAEPLLGQAAVVLVLYRSLLHVAHYGRIILSGYVA